MKVLALALAHALIRQWSLARSSHASLVTNSKSLLSTPQLFVPTDGSLFAYSLKSNPTSFWLLGPDIPGPSRSSTEGQDGGIG